MKQTTRMRESMGKKGELSPSKVSKRKTPKCFPRPRSYDCASAKLWDKYLKHGFDPVQLNRKDWAD